MTVAIRETEAGHVLRSYEDSVAFLVKVLAFSCSSLTWKMVMRLIEEIQSDLQRQLGNKSTL